MLILKTGSSCEHVSFQLSSFLWLLISRKNLSALFSLFFYMPTTKVLIFFLKIRSTTTTVSALKCHKLQHFFSNNEPQFLPTVPELVMQEEQSDFREHRTLGLWASGQLFVLCFPATLVDVTLWLVKCWLLLCSCVGKSQKTAVWGHKSGSIHKH